MRPKQQTPRPETDAAATSGFGGVATRLSSWAANLLATGVILIGGLVFGRQVLFWWGADTSQPGRVEQVVGPTGVLSELAMLEFGDFGMTMLRSEMEGSSADALARLRQMSRPGVSRAPLQPVAGPAELRMLAGTERLAAIDAGNDWEMFQIDDPLPMVVVVRDVDAGSTSSDQVASRNRRLVSWGMAVPSVAEGSTTPDSWTLFTYARDGESSEGLASLPPLPNGCRRTMSLASGAGDAVVGFTGEGPVTGWMTFYDGWCKDNQWQAARGWAVLRNQWARRYEHPRRGVIDVQIAQDSKRLRGLLNIASPTETQESVAE